MNLAHLSLYRCGKPPFVKWGRLAKPIFAADNDAMARAQSLLTGELLCGQVCPPLSPEQARDVLRWAGATS